MSSGLYRCKETFMLSVLLILCVGVVSSSGIQSSPMQLILQAQFDCYVSQNNPDSPYGREVVLNVRSYYDGLTHSNQRSYIQFNISAIPESAKILSAILWLYKNPEGANPGVRDIQVFRVTSAWNEYTLNWNNQPETSQELSAFSNVKGAMEWYSWDLTEDVKGWHKGSAINHGVMLKDKAEDSRIDYASVFLSREASHPENPFMKVDITENGSETTTTQTLPETANEWRILVLPVTIILAAATLFFLRKRFSRKQKSA